MFKFRFSTAIIIQKKAYPPLEHIPVKAKGGWDPLPWGFAI